MPYVPNNHDQGMLKSLLGIFSSMGTCRSARRIP